MIITMRRERGEGLLLLMIIGDVQMQNLSFMHKDNPPSEKKAKHGFSVCYNDSTRVTVPKDNENV